MNSGSRGFPLRINASNREILFANNIERKGMGEGENRRFTPSNYLSALRWQGITKDRSCRSKQKQSLVSYFLSFQPSWKKNKHKKQAVVMVRRKKNLSNAGSPLPGDYSSLGSGESEGVGLLSLYCLSHKNTSVVFQFLLF